MKENIETGGITKRKKRTFFCMCRQRYHRFDALFNERTFLLSEFFQQKQTVYFKIDQDSSH